MTRLVLLLTFVLSLCPSPVLAQNWTEGSIIGVLPTALKGPTFIYIDGDGSNPANNWPHINLAPEVWHTLSLSDIPAPFTLPPDIKAISLLGQLVTSGTNSNAYCSAVFSFRTPGTDDTPWGYWGAAVSSAPAGAYRENWSGWVSIVYGRVEFWWRYSEPSCSKIINLSLQAYVR